MAIQHTPLNYITQSQANEKTLFEDLDCYFFERNYYSERSRIGFEFSKKNTEKTENPHLSFDVF